MGGEILDIEVDDNLIRRFHMGSHQARERYFEAEDGTRFYWSTTRSASGFESWIRSPQGREEQFSAHRLRRDAKARARRLYDEHDNTITKEMTT